MAEQETQRQEQPEDVYPLGLGGSLLRDLMNFGLNNIYQYGKRTEGTNRQMSDLMQAIQAGQQPAPGAMRAMTEQAMNINPIMGMAKVFKPGADTLEGLLATLAQSGQGIGSRAKLRPAIRVGEEVFAGDVGGLHPTDLVTTTMQKRGVPAGNFQYGFQVPGEKPFIPESLAHVLAFPEGVAKIQRMLKQGLKIDDVLGALKFANENGRSIF
jgi:hypothetical protein